MANGTTVKECEFRKECERAYGREEDCGILSRGDVCVVRKVAILVGNKKIEDASVLIAKVLGGRQHLNEGIEALKTEVDWETP